MPQWCREILDNADGLASVSKNGNGACALHAAFGSAADPDGKLLCSSARDLAADILARIQPESVDKLSGTAFLLFSFFVQAFLRAPIRFKSL